MIHKIQPNSDSAMCFVQVQNRPELEARITIAVKNKIFYILERTLDHLYIDKKKKNAFDYDWCMNGSLRHLSLVGAPYASEVDAIEDVLRLGYEVFVFDTIKELAEFILKRS